MKKLSWLLVLAMLISMFAILASAEGDYAPAPMLDAAVEAGELPPLKNVSPKPPASLRKCLTSTLRWKSVTTAAPSV